MLDFLCEIMDDQNQIANNEQVRNEFNALLSKVTIPRYSESTIHKSFSRLSKLELLLIESKKRGVYKVNPLYFSRGEDSGNTNRNKMIRNDFEKYSKEIVNKYRHGKLSNKKTS